MDNILAMLGRQEFLLVAIGTMVLAVASGMVGTYNVLRGQSLIGDAISHAALPGVIIAFMVFQTRDPLVLTLGAIVAGTISFILIQGGYRDSKVPLDSLLAVVLSSMFGLGTALISGLRTFEFTKHLNRAGLNAYIYGQAAFTMQRDVNLIIAISSLSIILLLVFYKELKMFVFDEEFTNTSGFSPKIINSVLLVMTMVLIGIGMKIVGAILISSLLIVPGVVGMLWSKRLNIVLIIASIVGAFSAFCGTAISSLNKNTPTGASIVVILTSICVISLIFAPGGIINRAITRRKKLAELKARKTKGGVQ